MTKISRIGFVSKFYLLSGLVRLGGVVLHTSTMLSMM